MHKSFVLQWVYFVPVHVSNTCAHHHHQEVKIALHSLWYHHTYKCDDTRECVMQFSPPDDDEHMCLKHVEAWNKLILKQKFCASSWLITEINILRCTVSITSKNCKSNFLKISYCCFSLWRVNTSMISQFCQSSRIILVTENQYIWLQVLTK